jgi:hypothetical protein
LQSVERAQHELGLVGDAVREYGVEKVRGRALQ